jgi:DNA polymerase-3 subunit alpha
MLGLYVSDHPLAGLESQLAKFASTTILDLTVSEDVRDGDHVTVAGLVTEVQRRVAKNSGKPYGIIQIEDFSGEMSVMFLGRTYQDFGEQLANDQVVTIRGRVTRRDDGVALHASELRVPDLGSAAASTGPLTLQIPEQRASAAIATSLDEMLKRYPGDTEVRLRLTRGDTARIFELPNRVRITSDLYGELKSLLGPSCLA